MCYYVLAACAGDSTAPILLTKLDGATFRKVVEWCIQHKYDQFRSDDIPAIDHSAKYDYSMYGSKKMGPRQVYLDPWDEKFCKRNQELLMHLVMVIHPNIFCALPAVLDLSGVGGLTPSGASRSPKFVLTPPRTNSQNKSKIHCWPPLVFPQIEYWLPGDRWRPWREVYNCSIDNRQRIVVMFWQSHAVIALYHFVKN